MPPKAGLSREAVVQAAASLANEQGIQALTLGRLAERLGIRTPSLYNHVDGLPGLLRELALLNAGSMADRIGRAAIGKSGATALLAIARAYRAYIKESPGVYLASLRVSGNQVAPDPRLSQAEGQMVEMVMAALASFGLQGAHGLHAVRALRSLVHGFTTLEIAGGFGLPLDLDESFERMMIMMVNSLQEVDGPWR
jgi:AcrR family transcriptional regulator